MAEPQQVYYPSCVVNLRLRFDERLVLNAQGALDLEGYDTYQLAKYRNIPGAPTDIPAYSANPDNPNGLTYVNGRIPKNAKIELPAYRDAGKFSLTFDYRDIPLDPRTLRSCGVEIFLDAVQAQNFAAGITQSAPRNGERVSIMSAADRLSLLQQNAGRNGNLVMVGTVDSWQVRHTAKGSEVSIDGRDLRAVLMQSPIPPDLTRRVSLKNNIVKVVNDIVQTHPFGKKMNVVGSKYGWPEGTIPSPGDRGGLTRVRKGANGKEEKGSAGADPMKLNYWDLITRYCDLVGAVPYYSGEDLVIAPARSLYAQVSAGPSSVSTTDEAVAEYMGTPFRGGPREVGEKQPITVRRLVFGRNIDELNFERKFNGFVARTIHLVSLDTSSQSRGVGKLLEVYWPSKRGTKGRATQSQPSEGFVTSPDIESAQNSQVAPSGDTNKDEVRISVPGIRDKKRLLQIAQEIYEELGRGEQGGSVKTKNLASFGGGNADPDLLSLRPGDAVELLVDGTRLATGYPIRSPLNDNSRVSAFELTADIARRLGATSAGGTIDTNDPAYALARMIVATSRNLIFNLQNYFRASNVKFDWDINSGISVSFDFQNYIEARNAVTPITLEDLAKTASEETNTGVPAVPTVAPEGV